MTVAEANSLTLDLQGAGLSFMSLNTLSTRAGCRVSGDGCGGGGDWRRRLPRAF